MEQKSLYCLIMAGGVGSRFWPLGRILRRIRESQSQIPDLARSDTRQAPSEGRS